YRDDGCVDDDGGRKGRVPARELHADGSHRSVGGRMQRPGWQGAVAVAIAITVLVRARSIVGQAAPPDLIVYDAKVVTDDQAFSTSQAMAIRGGRFVAVGSDNDVLATAGPSTTKVDLHGGTVLPGFNDTHNHQNSGISLVTSVDLTNIHSIGD